MIYSGSEAVSLQWLRPVWCWSFRWSFCPSCWFCHWYHWWRWCPRYCTTASYVCWNGTCRNPTLYALDTTLITLFRSSDRSWFSFSPKFWVFMDLLLHLFSTPRFPVLRTLAKLYIIQFSWITYALQFGFLLIQIHPSLRFTWTTWIKENRLWWKFKIFIKGSFFYFSSSVLMDIISASG